MKYRILLPTLLFYNTLSISYSHYTCSDSICNIPRIDSTSTGEVFNIDMNNRVNVEIINLVSKINLGNRIINDMCDILEEKVSFLSGSDKPNCRYNTSYISNNSLFLFDTDDKIRSFLLHKKTDYCKNKKIECGELTIILKLLDLLNSIIFISIKLISVSEVLINLETTSFNELFILYTTSLDNYDILTNITLRKHRANIILETEQIRLKKLTGQNYVYKYGNDLIVYIGEPIKHTFGFIGETIGITLGGFIGGTIETTSPVLNISNENKLILFVIILVYLFKK